MIQDLAEILKLRGDDIVGMSDQEIREVREDQGLERLPGLYAEFLRRMGRKAGRLLVGTDAFYPAIIGLKNDAQELLSENNALNLIGEDAIVFAMHQGYQVYWMATVPDDPSVYMYQEGDEGLSKEWDSFSSFLREEASRIP